MNHNSPRMKILYTNFHPGDGGGHTTYVQQLCAALGAQHDLTVAAPGASQLFERIAKLPRVKAVAMDFPGKPRELGEIFRNLRKIRRLLTDRFDLIHVNGSPDHRMVIYACLNRIKRPRIVLIKHNSFRIRNNPFAWYRAALFTDAVIGVSRSTVMQLRASPYRRKPLYLVPNGIDTDHFSPPSAAVTAAIRQRLGIALGDLVCVSTAGTGWHKGWNYLIEACAQLPRELAERIRIVIAGHITYNVREYVDSSPFRDRIILSGWLDDSRNVLQGADLGFVLSWDVETISFACREMMSCGLPVIVSDYGGLRENITPGMDGWVVPPKDAASIAAILRQVVAEPARLRAMGLMARQKAVEQFGIDGFVTATEQVYRLTLEGIPGGIR